MKLDAGPILARKAAGMQKFNDLRELCVAVGEKVLPQFEPFEDFCGKPTWKVAPKNSDFSFRLLLSFGYVDACNRRLVFDADLLSPSVGLPKIVGLSKMVQLKRLSVDTVAQGFIDVHSANAELAFEAVVLKQPWRLARIFRWQ